MTVAASFSKEIDNSTGAYLFFRDTTPDYGVNGNINYSDVRAVRMVMTNWTGQQNPVTLTQGDALEQYRRYIKTSITTSVYDNKTLTLSSFFIPFIDGLTVLSGDTFETTGAFSTYISSSTYLPTSSFNVFPIPLSYWGITDRTTFEDMVYGLQYEIYVDTDPVTLTNVVNEKQYIVYGTTGTAVWNGNTYRIGEVFIASDNGAISFTGDAVVKVLEASVNNYFAVTYDIEKRLAIYVADNRCACENPKISEMYAQLEALKDSNYSQWESITNAMVTIADLQQTMTIIERNEI